MVMPRWLLISFHAQGKLKPGAGSTSKTLYETTSLKDSDPHIAVVYTMTPHTSIRNYISDHRIDNTPVVVLFEASQEEKLRKVFAEVLQVGILPDSATLEQLVLDKEQYWKEYIISHSQPKLTPTEISIHKTYMPGGPVNAPSPQYLMCWRVENFRRLMILCALFPNNLDIIARCSPEINLLMEGSNFNDLTQSLIPSGNTISFQILDELSEHIQNQVKQELCSSSRNARTLGETIDPLDLDSLRERVRSMITQGGFASYTQELTNPSVGFLGNGFVQANFEKVRHQNLRSDIHVAYFADEWLLTLGLPKNTEDGRLVDVDLVREFHSFALRHEKTSHAKNKIKVLIAPTFSASVIEECGILGIYLVDWVGLTYMRKLVLDEKRLHSDDGRKRVWEIFGLYGTGMIWNYRSLSDFAEKHT